MGCAQSSSATAYDQSAVNVHRDTSFGATAAAAMLTADAGLSSTIELSVSCLDLIKLDTFSDSDPLLVLSTYTDGVWRELGRSEIILNNNSPKFTKLFRLVYHFESIQSMKFSLYDIDSGFRLANSDQIDLTKQDFIGEVECKLASIVGSIHSTKTLPITNTAKPKRAKGTMTIVAEELAHQNDLVALGFSAKGLDKKDTFGKSDPFFRLLRASENGARIPVYKSEVIKKNLNPVWAPFTIGVQQVCFF